VIKTHPRLPCYKLGIRSESDDMGARFFLSGLTVSALPSSRGGGRRRLNISTFSHLQHIFDKDPWFISRLPVILA
jgi:hypothetical protein